MLFSDSYQTIAQTTTELYKDRGSKFLAFAFPVKNELEIKDYLQKLKKEHPSASHHCYAWRLGADKLAFRTNDDGEPNNTAGKPIFSQIQSFDLTNVLVVVVRYFGGTLLGVGGLIQAYKHAAELVLSKSHRLEQFIYFEYKIEFGFDDMSAVMRMLKEFDAIICTTTYENENAIVFQIKKHVADQLEQRIKDLYRTRLTFISVR